MRACLVGTVSISRDIIRFSLVSTTSIRSVADCLLQLLRTNAQLGISMRAANAPFRQQYHSKDALQNYCPEILFNYTHTV